MSQVQGKTHITQVGRVMVPCPIRRAIAFYVEKLGFELRADIPFGDGDRWVEVGPAGGEAALALVIPREGNAPGVMTNVALESSDIDADHASLRDGGVDVDDEVMRMGDPSRRCSSSATRTRTRCCWFRTRLSSRLHGCGSGAVIRTCVRVTAATILHADLDAFFASVAQRDDPRLRGEPVIVGGGVVLAASYEARAFGVRSAMGGRNGASLPARDRRLARLGRLRRASRAVVAIFEDTAPFVERISIDEAFLDVRGLERISGTPPRIAATLRRRVREEVGLPISVGVARTKEPRQMASAQAKPDGMLVVDPGASARSSTRCRSSACGASARRTAAKLHARGLTHIGQLCWRSASRASSPFSAARRAATSTPMAAARDPRPVRHGRGRGSFGAQSALGRRVMTPTRSTRSPWRSWSG